MTFFHGCVELPKVSCCKSSLKVKALLHCSVFPRNVQLTISPVPYVLNPNLTLSHQNPWKSRTCFCVVHKVPFQQAPPMKIPKISGVSSMISIGLLCDEITVSAVPVTSPRPRDIFLLYFALCHGDDDLAIAKVMVPWWWLLNGVPWKIPKRVGDLPSGYVKIAMENDHRNSGYTQ